MMFLEEILYAPAYSKWSSHFRLQSQPASCYRIRSCPTMIQMPADSVIGDQSATQNCATVITRRARSNYIDANYIDDTNGCYSSSAPYLRNPPDSRRLIFRNTPLNPEQTLTEIQKNNIYHKHVFQSNIISCV